MISLTLATALAASAAEAGPPPHLRQAYSTCLISFMKAKMDEKLDEAAFRAGVKAACAPQEGALRDAIVSYDVKTGMKKTTAEEAAALQVDDYLVNTADSYGRPYLQRGYSPGVELPGQPGGYSPGVELPGQPGPDTRIDYPPRRAGVHVALWVAAMAALVALIMGRQWAPTIVWLTLALASVTGIYEVMQYGTMSTPTSISTVLLLLFLALLTRLKPLAPT